MVDNHLIGKALTVLENIAPQQPEETLPTVTLDIPQRIQIDDTLKAVQSADLAHSNNMIELIYAYIPQIKSISSLCKLTDTLMNVVEKRRKQLCLQYGAESKGSSSRLLEPDD